MVRTSTEGGHVPVQDVRVKTELRRASPGEREARMVIYAGEPQIWEVDYIQKN